MTVLHRLIFAAFLLLPFASAQTPAEQKNYWRSPEQLRGSYSKQSGLVYAKVDSRELKLDLYLPNGAQDKPVPGILFIHGGGWAGGNIKTCARQSAVLAAEGYAVACIEYRLIPNVRIKGCVADSKAAVRWLRANANTYNIDPDRIAAIGGSAGGHLTAMLAITSTHQHLEGTGGNLGTSSAVQAAIAMATPSDLDNPWVRKQFKMQFTEAREISPMRHVHKEQAPMLLLHCKQDRLVPYIASGALVLASKGVGAQCTLTEIRHGGHAFWHNPKGWNETMRAALPFLEATLKQKAE